MARTLSNIDDEVRTKWVSVSTVQGSGSIARRSFEPSEPQGGNCRGGNDPATTLNPIKALLVTGDEVLH